MSAAPAVGQPLERADAAAKVRGTAHYAAEVEVDDPAYVHLVTSSVAKGSVAAVDVAAAAAANGVLTVLTHENAPRLASDDDRWL